MPVGPVAPVYPVYPVDPVGPATEKLTYARSPLEIEPLC